MGAFLARRHTRLPRQYKSGTYPIPVPCAFVRLNDFATNNASQAKEHNQDKNADKSSSLAHVLR